MTSRADAYTRVAVLGSLALAVLFVSLARGINHGFDIVENAIDGIPETVESAVKNAPLVRFGQAVLTTADQLGIV